MNKYIKFLLVAPALAVSAGAMAQSDQTYATYITEEQWQMVNELPGVDRQIVSRDIGKLNLSVGIIHRGAGDHAHSPDRDLLHRIRLGYPGHRR